MLKRVFGTVVQHPRLTRLVVLLLLLLTVGAVGEVAAQGTNIPADIDFVCERSADRAQIPFCEGGNGGNGAT